jgi:thioredoxin-dependent peroxiredoxin
MPPSPALAVKDPAPLFTLKDQNGSSISLAAARGKHNVVLIFYPGDMTPGCTMQLCAVRDDWSKFRSSDTLVFGVNHGSTAHHRAFLEKHSFPFPLLIDSNKSVSKSYGALRSLLGLSIIRRTVVGINKDGIIVYLKRGMPKNADILKAFSS